MSKVLIAVGHGRKPNGSMDPGSAAGSKTEQTEGSKIARACVSRLRALGVTTRLVDKGGPNWSGAARIANDWGADLAVEVHHDWSRAPRGAFGHWASAKGKALADDIFRAVEAAGMPMRPSWHKRRPELGWLRTTDMPAVLWECDRIGAITEHERYGRAIADGIAAHLGITPPDDSSDEEGIVAQLPKIDLSGVRDGKPGSYVRGDDVKRLQALLAANGHPPDDSFDDDGEPDGSGGPGTKDALGGFQKRHRTGKPSSPSTPDHVVGDGTWSALLGVR